MTQIHTHQPDDHDSAYEGLLVDDAHWAFGSGQEFEHSEDPLAGVDTTVPDGVDPTTLATYCLMLGDDALVMSHRLAELTSRAPDLEEDIAIANIALDLLGQARLLLTRAAAADPEIVPGSREARPTGPGPSVPAEDALAFFRGDQGFRNVRLVEVPNGDFGETIARLVLFSTYRLALFERLTASRDQVLASIAAKGVKELAYHRDFAGRWFLTLAQGTDESRRRVLDGLAGLLPLWPELFDSHQVEAELAAAGIGVDPSGLAAEVEVVLDQVLAVAGVTRPQTAPLAGVRRLKGRDGMHTEALSKLLAEMQVVAREHPTGRW